MGLKVSVAMCTYNGERYINEQIGSILGQTAPVEEIIVCDDQSEDQTCCIIEEINSRNPGIIHLYQNEKKLGIAQNFFKAMHLCSGDVVFLCDQDDVWMKDKVASFLAAFADNPEAKGVLSDAVLTDESLNPLGKTLWESLGFSIKKRRMIRGGHAERVMGKGPFVTGAALAVKKEWLKDVGLPKAPMLHDEWLGWFINNAMAFIERPTFCYRQHHVQAVGARYFSGPSDRMRYMGSIVKTAEKDQFPPIDCFQALACALKMAGIPENILKCVEEKMAFMVFREALPVARMKRLFRVLAHMNQYALYANGYKSVIKDIIRKINARSS